MKSFLLAVILLPLVRISDGELDTNFAVQGRFAFTTDTGGQLNSPVRCVVQTDGKPLIFGASTVASCNTIAAHHLLADGSAHDLSYGSAGIATVCLDGSRLGDGCNRNLQPRNARRQFGALASGWIGGEPLEPLFVHAGEVVFIGQHYCDADELV